MLCLVLKLEYIVGVFHPVLLIFHSRVKPQTHILLFCKQCKQQENMEVIQRDSSNLLCHSLELVRTAGHGKDRKGMLS